MIFVEETEHFSGKKWSVKVEHFSGEIEHNVQKPIPRPAQVA